MISNLVSFKKYAFQYLDLKTIQKMKQLKSLLCLTIIIGLFANCNSESEEVNQNLARLNNKSWQLSRIIDSISNTNKKYLVDIIGENKDEVEALAILKMKLESDSTAKLKWKNMQLNDLKIDSIEQVRAVFLDTINIYVDRYSKLHPEEKVILK